MQFKELDALMRQKEAFHSIRIPDNHWIVIRLDGRSFSKLTKLFNKPFDHAFNEYMDIVSKKLLDEFQPSLVYHQSDEISMMFPKDYSMFSRSLEKLVSVTASFASSQFTAHSLLSCSFDSRIWMTEERQSVVDYFMWRRQDSVRNSLNCAAYWALRQQGRLSKSIATAVLQDPDFCKKTCVKTNTGVSWDDFPAKFKFGTVFYKESVPVDGYNPITQESVKTIRNKTFSLLPGNQDLYMSFLGLSIR